MFDLAFFGGAFSERVREFSRSHDDANVRLEVVTLNGERLDALELSAVETGTRLSTRDQRLVFLPYSLIAYVEVAILQDHRVSGFQLLLGTEQPYRDRGWSRPDIRERRKPSRDGVRLAAVRPGQAFGPKAASTTS